MGRDMGGRMATDGMMVSHEDVIGQSLILVADNDTRIGNSLIV